ncbi:MAG: carbohydrate ABC transporter permease [Candidatus Aenigmatarchaeota archaeon]
MLLERIHKVSFSRIIIYTILIIFALVTIFPLYHMIIVSLGGYGFSFSLIPLNPRIDEYLHVLIATEMINWLINTFIYAGSVSIFTVFLDSLIAYPLAKGDFKGRNFIFLLVISYLMIPEQAVIIPLFKLMGSLGLINNLLALILPGIISPTGVFLMRQYILNVPSDILDSARIDGSSEIGIYWRIILPVCKPALLTVAALKFIMHWNMFLYPLVMLRKSSMFTVPVGIATISWGMFGANWNLMSAACIISIIPTILIFLFFQKQIQTGIILRERAGIKR